MFANQETPLVHDTNSIETKALAFLNNNVPLRKLYEHNATFEKVLVISLTISLFYPSKKEQIGVFWLDDCRFALKIKNFSKTYGVTNSGMNKNLQFHHIIQVGKMRQEELQEFEDKNYWKIMRDETGNFCQSKIMNGYQNLLKFDPHYSKREKKHANTKNLKIGEELDLNTNEEIGTEPEFYFANLMNESEEEINESMEDYEILFNDSLDF